MKLALIVQSGSYNRLHLMTTLIATSVAMGWEASALLTYDALHRYVTDTMDEAKPSLDDPEINQIYADGIHHGTIPSIQDLLDQCKRNGSVKLYGCSQSVMMLRLTMEQQQKLDGVIGYTTFLTSAIDARLIVI